MIQFQQSMLQMTQAILLTQQQVMLCYLQSIRFAPGTTSSLEHPSRVAPFQTITAQTLQVSEVPPICSIVAPLRTHYNEQTIASSAEPSFVDEPSPAPSLHSQSMIDDTDELKLELDNDGLVTALLNLISERTGYPTDMLEPDLDLESDLGIDSIKRIEILNNFQKLLPEAKKAQFNEGSIEELAGARTLNQLIDWIKQPAPIAVASK